MIRKSSLVILVLLLVAVGCGIYIFLVKRESLKEVPPETQQCSEAAKKEASLAAQRHFKAARKAFFEENDLVSAEKELEQLLKVAPNFKAEYLQFMLGVVREHRNIYKEAIKRYRNEIKENKRRTPEDIKAFHAAYLRAAESCFKLGLLYKALFSISVNSELNYYNARIYLAPRLASPNLPEIYYFKARCHYYLGEIEETLSSLKEISSTSTLKPFIQILSGAALYLKGEKDKAKEIFNQIERNYQGNSLIISQLAATYTEIGLKPIHVPELKKGGNLNQVRSNLISVYLKQDRINEAEALSRLIDYRKPVRVVSLEEVEGEEYNINFYDPAGLNYLAGLYFRQAISFYQEYINILEEKKKADRPRCQIGICQLLSGSLEEAISTFKALIESSGTTPGVRAMALINLGTALHKKGARQEASSYWRLALTENSNNPRVKSDLGCVYARLMINLDQALELARAEEVKPGPLAENLGWIHFKRGLYYQDPEEMGKALGLLEKNHIQEAGYSLAHNDPLLLLKMAAIFFNRKMYSEGAEVLLHFRELYPESQQALTSFQLMSQTWKVIKWDKDIRWEPTWFEVWY